MVPHPIENLLPVGEIVLAIVGVLAVYLNRIMISQSLKARLLSVSTAGPAHPADPGFSHADVRVLGRVLVALRAMGLSRIGRRRALTAQDVLTPRDGFQVSGVDAPPIAAQVIQLQPIRHWADQQLVDHSVRPVASQTPVASSRPLTEPWPAGGRDLNTVEAVSSARPVHLRQLYSEGA